MTKLTMYSVCLEALTDNPRVWLFDELLELVVNAGFGNEQELRPKLYANAQVWASQKKIARGSVKGTFQAISTPVVSIAKPINKPVVVQPTNVPKVNNKAPEKPSPKTKKVIVEECLS